MVLHQSGFELGWFSGLRVGLALVEGGIRDELEFRLGFGCLRELESSCYADACAG